MRPKIRCRRLTGSQASCHPKSPRGPRKRHPRRDSTRQSLPPSADRALRNYAEQTPISRRTTVCGDAVVVVRALLLPIADELRIGIVADIATAISMTKATTASASAGVTTGGPGALDAGFAALLQQLAPDASVTPSSIMPANDLDQAGKDNVAPAAQTDPSPQSTPQAAFDSSALIALLQNTGLQQPTTNAVSTTDPRPSGAAGEMATPVTAGTKAAEPALQDGTASRPAITVLLLQDAQAPAAPSLSPSSGPPRESKSDSEISAEPDRASATQLQTDNAAALPADATKPTAKNASNEVPDANSAIAMLSQAVPQQTAPSQQQSTVSDAATAIATATAGAKPAAPASANGCKAASAREADQLQSNDAESATATAAIGAKPSAPAPSKDSGKPSIRVADQSQAGDAVTSDTGDTSAKSAATKQIAANADTPQFDARKVDAHTNTTSAQTAPPTDAGPNAQSSGSGQLDGSLSSAATAASAQAPAGTSSATAVGANLQVTPQHHDAATSSTLDSLGVTIAAKSADGARHFDIRLDPPDLGRVDVRLSMDDSGNARASLIVDKPQTLELLQRDASNLNRALSEAGLSLSNNGLNFSLRGQDRQSDGGSVVKGRSRELSVKAVMSTDAISTSSSIYSLAPDSVRLDIRV